MSFDYGALMSIAQRNSSNKKEYSYYPSTCSRQKREAKQPTKLSENIKRFLERKDHEKNQKALEEKKKRENLLSLRDQKTQNRINKHLKVCKAANKSVLEDATENNNTAVTAPGLSQPDEDDYGYVSPEAASLYDKLMNKYKNLPPEKPLYSNSEKKVVKDIASTKDRVRQALKQETEDPQPHKRRKKVEEIEKEEIQEAPVESEKKPKLKKQPAPPPLSFHELLKIAEKKQYEPVVIPEKPKVKEERLLTKKQIKEQRKEKEWLERRNQRSKNPECNTIEKTQEVCSEKVINKTSSLPNKKSSERSSSQKISEKDALFEERRKLEERQKQLAELERSIEAEKRQLEMRARKMKENGKAAISASKKPTSKESTGKSSFPKSTASKSITLSKSKDSSNVKSRECPPSDVKPRQVPPASVKPKQLTPADGKPRKCPPPVVKSRQFPPADVKPRQFPPADVKPRQFPPADVKSRQFPPADVGKRPKSNSTIRPKLNKRRIYDTDEEEYDSELDDFIDDGPQGEEEDVSKCIYEIFGYDKSRYKDVVDDDIDMESSFAQQLKEEYVSTKIGIMEDLEDIRKEALEKKLKAKMKKKIKK